MAEHPRVFVTEHAAATAMRYHHHGVAFATLVLEGAYTEVRDGVPRVCPAGTLVLHDADEEHADYFTAPTRCRNILLDDRAAQRIQAARAAHAHDVGAERTLPAWLQASLASFDWTGAAPLREAARLAGLHPVHFSRAFHRHLGTTPNVYRRRARLRRASTLLLAGSASLATIAQSCGFSDQSHLTRTFSAALGLTPAAYRRTFAR
jgi:AraC-like DNA-binding protein